MAGWVVPIDALPASLCAAGRALGDPRVAPDGSAVAFVVRDAVGARVVTVPTGGGDETVVAADPAPAGRGGVLAWLAGGRLAYVTASGGVAVAGPRGEVVRLPVGEVEGGASGLAASPDGASLAYVGDTRAVCVVAPDGQAPVVVSSAADFALDPAWSPDGALLAWHEWDVPAMSWDASRIVIAPARPGGGGERVVVAGGDDVAVQEPRWSPDGSALAYLSDATGWCNLWVAGPGGESPRPLVDEPYEHGGPAWGSGAASFAWSPDGREIAFTRNEAGFGRLCVVDVAGGRVRDLARGVHSSLTWAGRSLACVRTGARTPTAVVAVDPGGGARRVLATGPDPALAALAEGMPEPEVVRWTAPDGAVVPGRLWRPPPGAPVQGPPPLLVWAHGGPTDQRRVTFDPRIAFFASRGWAVLHPDHRGTTGWGRAWAQALRGRWGEVDVDDTLAGADAAVANGWGDRRRLVAIGSSAGGMTALLALARRPDLWAAGVAVFPVVDLEGLAAATHRFEAHYTVGLVGPLPAAAGLHRTRSPLAVADRITAPLLLLHGADDAVVPPGRSRDLADLVRARGVAVEHHEYEGEGHGWRSPATTADDLQRTESFLSRHAWSRPADMGR